MPTRKASPKLRRPPGSMRSYALLVRRPDCWRRVQCGLFVTRLEARRHAREMRLTGWRIVEVWK